MPITMHKIRQNNPVITIADPAAETVDKLRQTHLGIQPGQSIGIAVGSRGINSIDIIVRAVVDYVLSCDARPFIIPAMGSHGGATAEGQRELLAGYGITEALMGVPVIAGMSVHKLDAPECSCKVFMSSAALDADGVILVNRIKPHTDYHGMFESGLVKMCVIGLGKHAQALEIHKYGVKGLKEYIPQAAKVMFNTGKIIGGVGIVENTLDKPSRIEVIAAAEIMNREPDLLAQAGEMMARLPVDDIDLLIVDYIGKDFSGTGLDTNVIGRMKIRGEPEPLRPRIKSIFIRDLSPRSHGNALGIGFAEVITERLHEKIDFEVMYENAITSTFFERVKIPMVAANDRLGVRYALRCCGDLIAGNERVVRIRNTLTIDELYVSDPLLRELSGRKEIAVIGESSLLYDGDDIGLF